MIRFDQDEFRSPDQTDPFEFQGPVETPSNVDLGDVSGGTTSASTAQAAEQIEEFNSEGGGTLAIVYGEHLIAGHLIVHKFTPGAPNQLLLFIALGEGQGDKGGHGEWDSAVTVWYAGDAQSVSPNGATAGYRFFEGEISTGVASGPQQVDAFLSGNLAYSGTAGIAIRVDDVDDRPERVRVRAKGRKTANYNRAGTQTGYAYFPEPHQTAADRIRAYYEHKYATNAALAAQRFQEKVDWNAWFDWALFNSAQISWFNGTTTSDIFRFNTHIAFTTDVTLADALDQICATAGAHWQDDGEQIIFLPPSERAPVHHFDESNIVGAPSVEPRDAKERPNYFVCEFRDFDDPFLGMSSVEVRRDELIRQVGENKSVRALPTMKQSQAQRLLERQARLEADNPEICRLVGSETSIHVLPGDFVTVSHTLLRWVYQRCLVLDVNLSSAEQGVDFCEFTLQKITDLLYSDTAHGPRQGALTP